jgi:HK97 gp10 family phage protein
VADDFLAAMAELNSIAVALQSDAVGAATKARAAVHKSAADVERWGKTFVPVDTGATKSSIGVDFAGSNAVQSVANIGPTTSYAPHLEWGTVHMAPRAFMGPAADLVFPDFQAAILACGNPLGGR